MNLTNAQVSGIAVAVLGFVFAGAYATASHQPHKTERSATPSNQVHHVQVVDRSVPEASDVFKNSINAPMEQPATF